MPVTLNIRSRLGRNEMERVEAIRTHELYRTYYSDLQQCEAGRIFCRHDMSHFLDVARIAYILDLEQRMGISREVIYAAALLHDIGRALEYRQGIPHAEAGVAIAAKILTTLPAAIQFTQIERKDILAAIETHRGQDEKEKSTVLSGLIQQADHLSRQCYLCHVRDACKWNTEKMNVKIHI